MGKVLLVGFGSREHKRMTAYFRSVDVVCDTASSVEAALQKIPKDPPTLVVAERPARLEEIHGLRDVLRQAAPATPFLLVLPETRMDLALPALRAGAYDCLARPLDKTQVLAAAKRAALRNGRTLFVPKIRPRRRRSGLAGALILGFLTSVTVLSLGTRPSPAPTLNLGSATVSGIQWDGRRLWVGNWYDSTLTLYELGRSAFSKSTRLLPREVVRLADVQPILLCDAPKNLFTVGFDLMIRSHDHAAGLPVEHAEKAPGTNPTGLAWDGKFLWTVDGNTGLLYRHGEDLKVIETVPSIIPQPTGLTADHGLWVVGGSPLRAARLEKRKGGYVWKGPYVVADLLPEGVPPSGVAVGYHRLWAVSGGNPEMTSVSLGALRGIPSLWKKAPGAP
jgi:hypothetical protein